MKNKYRIWDNQLKHYAFQDHIFNSKLEAIDQLISYFSADCDGDLTKIRKCLWECGEFSDLAIEKMEK